MVGPLPIESLCLSLKGVSLPIVLVIVLVLVLWGSSRSARMGQGSGNDNSRMSLPRRPPGHALWTFAGG